MNRRRMGWVVLGFTGLALGIAPLASTRAAAQAAGDGTLAVTVTYKGKGAVTPTNAIAVFLFDSPTISDASQPIGMQKIEKSGGAASFTGVSSPTVYVAITYDEKGTYAGQGPPPPGTPYTIYQRKAKTDQATPVKIAKGTKVSVTFDDSQRW